MHLIEINSLTKDFGSVRAVDDLSFAIEPGRIIGFLGPFITRSQTAALLIVIGLFPIEKTAGLLLEENAAYMPYGPLQSLIDQGGTVSPAPGAMLLGLTTASVVIVAWRLTTLRDVT